MQLQNPSSHLRRARARARARGHQTAKPLHLRKRGIKLIRTIWRQAVTEVNTATCHLQAIWLQLRKLKTGRKIWARRHNPRITDFRSRQHLRTSKRWTCSGASTYPGSIPPFWRVCRTADWTWGSRMPTSASTSSSLTRQWETETGILVGTSP